jgi:hypothetical protein
VEVRTLVVLSIAALLVSCTTPQRDVLVRVFDAGDSGVEAATAQPDAADAAVDPTLGGPCIDDAQCDDGVPCTFDRCDQALKRCRNVPDDSLCDDHVYCNGREVCHLARGCGPGPVVTCQDGDPCTVDACVESSQSCTHTPRDADADGDPDGHCPPGKDCNDADPTVSSKHAEVCANGKDDNCDGRIDETPCVEPANDTCATALAVGGPGTYAMSTVGTKRDYGASCGVTTPTSAHDVVAAITVPAGGSRDVDLWATAATGETAVAIFSACGQAQTELACGAAGASTARARARGVPPGTYYAVVTTQTETQLELAVDLLAPSTKPTNETCFSAAPVTLEQPFPVQLIDAAKDLQSACAAATGELTYTFTLAASQDVRVFSTTTRGTGAPVIGLRNATCTSAGDEIACASSNALPLFARALAPGSYVLTVSASAPIDASITVRAYAPTAAPADQTCATAPSVALNGAPQPLTLANHTDAVKDGCYPGHPTAALAFTLGAPSDVLVVGRFPQTEIGAVSLDQPACAKPDVLGCASGSTPTRVSRRSVPPGDYRVVVSDQIGADDTVDVLVRGATPPTLVGALGDTCAAPFDLSESGGFYSGDTTGLGADFDDGCDTSSSPGGAPDQVGRLVLTQTRRVVFDMSGSVYTTILDVRQGATCPGQEVPGLCYIGFGPSRSFLDVTLDAGTYWIVIDGYAMSHGAWNLDLRVF